MKKKNLVRELRCFRQTPHAPHKWTWYYDEQPEKKFCPGVKRK